MSLSMTMLKNSARLLVSVVLLAVLPMQQATAQMMDTKAPSAILLDASTGAVLFEKNADEPFEPASMSKLMTVYLAFEAIKQGAYTLDSEAIVSDNVWRQFVRDTSSSKMMLNAGDVVTMEQLLKGIIVSSGNDATVALAEFMAGSEQTFVEWMNIKAEELGMKNSHFKNTHGLPAEGHLMSARDLSILALHLVNDFPELYSFFKETEFTYGIDINTGLPITQKNRLPVLYNLEGADGLKTGHTNASGYALTASAVRDGRRLVLVFTGLSSARERASEAARLLEYGFRNFQTYKLFSAGEKVEEANVWLGENSKINLIAAEDVVMTLSRAERARMDVIVKYNSPIPAPIAAGQSLATANIMIPNREAVVVPLVAEKAVEDIGGFAKLGAAFKYILFGSS